MHDFCSAMYCIPNGRLRSVAVPETLIKDPNTPVASFCMSSLLRFVRLCSRPDKEGRLCYRFHSFFAYSVGILKYQTSPIRTLCLFPRGTQWIPFVPEYPTSECKYTSLAPVPAHGSDVSLQSKDRSFTSRLRTYLALLVCLYTVELPNNLSATCERHRRVRLVVPWVMAQENPLSLRNRN
ncbi:hypothetical protein BDW68DRAFT_156164 [Aspergillus falconensis]